MIDQTKMVLPVLVRMLVVFLFAVALFMLLSQDELDLEELEISLTVTSASDEVMQLFWLIDADDQHQLKDRSKGLVPGTHRYYYRLAESRDLSWFRLDPATRPTEIILEEIVLGWGPDRFITLRGLDLYKATEPVQQVYRELNRRNSSLRIVSTGVDPILRIDIDRLTWSRKITRIAAAVVVSMGAGLALLLTLSYLCSSMYSARSYSTYPSRPWHWVGWAMVMLLAGALLTVAVPVPLDEQQPLIHFLALSYTIGIASFSPIFWFATRPPGRMAVLEAQTSRYAWLLYALPCIAVWSFYLVCFWPGSMSPDSLDQWHQVLHTDFKDWHPAFHTMNIWLITRAALSPALVAAVQILALASAVGWSLSVLQRYGISKAVLWITALLIAICPVNGLMAITLWKDLAYSVVLLILAVYLLQIVMSDAVWLVVRRNWLLLGFILALVSLYRHNGVIPAFCTIAALLVLYRRRWIGITAAALAALVLTIGIRGPLYDMLDVNRGNPMQKAFQSLQREVFPMSFFRAEKEKVAGNPENWQTLTAPHQPEKSKPASWAAARVKSDLQKMRDRVYSASRLWRIQPLQTFHKRIEYANLWEEQGKDGRKIRYVSANQNAISEHSLLPAGRDLLYQVFNWTKHHPVLFWMWRPAVYLYMLTALFIIQSWRMRKNLWLVLMPALVNSLPIFLVVFHKSIFRYHYPLVLLGMVLILPLLFFKWEWGFCDPDSVSDQAR